MALISPVVVKRTFFELAEFAEPQLPRARFSTDSVVSRWADELEDELDVRTTVMLRGLDSCMDRDALLRVLNSSRFRGCFDFLYVPCGFNTLQPQGFAFVNFV